MGRYYEKMNEEMKVERCPRDDKDGKITGHIILGVQEWFDENPEERIRLGWTKHITWDDKEIKEKWPHNHQTQYLVRVLKQIDEYTVEDDYRVMDKSEEQLLFEEMLSVSSWGSDGVWILD